MDIYAAILRAVAGGSRKTHIVYEANLNFNQCEGYLKDLRENGLIEVKSRSPLAWIITEDGRKFLKKYDEIGDILSRSAVRKHSWDEER